MLKNYENDRWPAGNPETGYTNTDGSPAKTEILNLNRSGENHEFWKMNFGKHPKEELYQISIDEDCVTNLADSKKFQKIKKELKNLLEKELKQQGDPRMFGKGAVFDSYPPNNGANLYEKYMQGEKVNTGWINDSDFEKNVKNED
jgi:N-sulfoglucosamine sulfohydrolase